MKKTRSEVPRWIVAQIVASQALLALLLISGAAFFEVQMDGMFVLPFTALFCALSAVFISRSLKPVGRLLLTAHEAQSQLGDSRRFRVASASWKDLERVIDQMRETLQSRSEILTREREELRVLMGSISDSIVAIDLRGIPLFFNTRFSLFFQHPERLDDLKTPIEEFFSEPMVGDSFRKTLRDGIETTVPALKIPLRDLGNRYFTVSISPLRDSKARVYGAVGIFHDVTELKIAEQMRIDFVANVSHELRTPLTSIKGYADTLIGDVRAGQKADVKFLEIIERNVGRLMSLISDILDLSWLESGESLQMDTIHLEELTGRVLAQLREGIEKKKQKLNSFFDAKVLFGDSSRIEQVLINLVENAIKYTPEESQIDLRWEDAPESVVLRVKDNGPGLKPEHLPRLFERFYRVDKARSREQGGTGLGLAIVKHIVQRHGGSVSVQSEPQKGTEFICRFPKRSAS